MSIYERNILALSQIDAALAKAVDESQIPDGVLEVFQTQSGVPSVKCLSIDKQMVSVHSAYDPIAEAVEFAKQEIPAADVYFFIGMGLGYHLIQMLPSFRGKHLGIVEMSPALFKAAMQNVDLRQVIERPRTRFFVGDNFPRFLDWTRNLIEDASAETTTIVTVKSCMRLNPGFYSAIHKELDGAVNKRMVEIETLTQMCVYFERNTIRNIPNLARSSGVISLKNRFSGMPAVLVAAGPSLNEVIDHLPGIEKKAVVFCALKSLRLLLSKGIIPHFVVNIDMTEHMMKCLEGLDVPKDVTLVYDPDSYHGVPAAFPGKLMTFGTISHIAQWVEEKFGPWGTLRKGMTVAHEMFYLARRFGCDPVIMCGMDFSFPKEKTHADGVTMTWTGKITEQTPDTVLVPSVDGKKVVTTLGFWSFITTLEADISESTTRAINTSPYGALIKGANNMSIADALAGFCTCDVSISTEVEQVAGRVSDIDVASVFESIETVLETSEKGIALVERARKAREPAEINRLGAKMDDVKNRIAGTKCFFLMHRLVTASIRRINSIGKKVEAETDPHKKFLLQADRMQEFFTGAKESAEKLRELFVEAGYGSSAEKGKR